MGKENHSTRRKMILTIFYHQAKRGASKDADSLLSPELRDDLFNLSRRLCARPIHHNYAGPVSQWRPWGPHCHEIQLPDLFIRIRMVNNPCFDKAPIFRWLISIPSMSMFQASEFSFNLVKRSKPRSGCIEFKIVKLRTRMNDKFSQLLLSWAPFNRTQGLASIQQTNKHRGRLLSQKAHSNSCCASQKWSIQIKQIGRSQKDLEVLGPPTKFTQRRSVILWICNVFGS